MSLSLGPSRPLLTSIELDHGSGVILATRHA
jgi:hypothetical protein